MAEELSLDLDSLTIVDEELEQFRQAWKAEVDQRARSHQSEAKEPPAKAGSSSEQRTANKIGIRRTVGAKAESKPATSPAVGAQRSEASKSATSSAGASEPASALDIYDTAVRFEREGNLSKALEHYQRAFRLDDQVDSKWRGLWQRGELEQVMVRKEEEKDQPDFSYHYFERESAPFAFETSATVAQELATTALAFEPKRKNKIVPLAIIPDELILVLLKHVAWMDPYALVNVGLVNKKLYMLSREQVVWRELCEKTYRPTVATIQSLENELTTFNSDWKLMFLKKARVRFDGLYISRCHYWRPGQTEFGLTNPYIMVTYFRYMRFYRDGTAITLCSTMEPIEAVKLFRRPPKNVKSLMAGTWTMSGNKLEVLMTDKDRPNTVFSMKLIVRSTGHSCMNSIKWERYTSVTPPYDEVEYPLNTLKSFAFSRVRSMAFPVEVDVGLGLARYGRHLYSASTCGNMLRAEEDVLLPVGTSPTYSSRPEGRARSIWEAAKDGDLDRVAECLKSGAFTANDRDEGNVTPLHWAAIHKHIEIARLLLDRGADPNAKGGDLGATPVHWAARSGLLEVMSLLCKRGGNPNLYDGQGYNALHLAAHGAHYLMILYLVVCQSMDLDSLDSMGRTALMWLAYMGLSQECLEQVLKLKPDVNRQDSIGFTALHWAVVTGHFEIAQSLILSGADTTLKDHESKTVDDWAGQHQKEKDWRSVKENASSGGKAWLSPSAEKSTLFVIPFLALPIAIYCFAVLPWYLGMIAAGSFTWATMTGVTKLLGKNANKKLVKTPFPTAIFQASACYVLFTWLFRLLPNTSFLINVLFIFLWSMTMYQLYRVIFGDPGFLPYPRTMEERQTTLASLVDQGQLDEKTYCTVCEVRRPLRSKHCKISGRCVARFDHFCPWTLRTVGALNHVRFLTFVAGFVGSVVVFDLLAIEYYSNLQYSAEPAIAAYFPCSFPTAFCNMLAIDSWTFLLAIWSAMQLFWCLPLLVSHLYYAISNTTTYESIKYGSSYPPRKNPYDRGIIANVNEFLFEGRKWLDAFPADGEILRRERSIELV